MSDDGRVAIVAGAGGELGRATATTLADRGFTVVGIDRSEAGLKELPDSVGREGADATDPGSAHSVVDVIAGKIGPPAVLVNTIGGVAGGGAPRITPGKPRPLLDVNPRPA